MNVTIVAAFSQFLSVQVTTNAHQHIKISFLQQINGAEQKVFKYFMCISHICPISDQLNKISARADADLTERIGAFPDQSDDLIFLKILQRDLKI